MTEQMALNGDRGQGPFTRLYLFARWLAVSLVAAWLAPFIVVGLVAAVTAVLGMSAADVRENVVGFATLEPAEWTLAGGLWQGYAWFVGGGVLLWRVFTAKPVEAAARKVFEPAVQQLERLPRGVLVALICAFSIAGLALVAQSRERTHTRVSKLMGALPPLSKPLASAALTLPSGVIRSGQATVEQHGDDTFIVVFKTNPAM